MTRARTSLATTRRRLAWLLTLRRSSLAPDSLALLVLLALSVAAEWDRLFGPTWIGMDTATAFFPWYTFLGEQLRAGHIPVWNPHQFAGAPFAADPESGWMYLPAMLWFSLLPLDAAVRAHLLFHVMLAAGSAYALARALGSNALGGLLAATIYAHSGFFEGHNVCCFAYADVAAWLPLLLLGAERAIRSTSWRSRALWWGVSGLALSQILAAWVGQGVYYAVLVLGSFIAFRCAASVGPGVRSGWSSTRVRSSWLSSRVVFARLFAQGAFTWLANVAVHTAGVLLFGFSLAAAGLLPRLEYNLVSNLTGGYPDADVSLHATTWWDWGVIGGWDRLLLQPSFEYIGWPALVLAVAALPLARRNSAVLYFAALGVVVLTLARAEPTPLHAAFSVLPGFERLHARSPERALIVLYLAPALLAAATLTAISRTRAVATPALGLLVVAAVAWDLHAAWNVQAAQSLAGGGDYQFARVDLAAYFAPTPASRFLTSQLGREPFRYLGYAGHVFGGPMPYTLRWDDPSITALEVNNRALLTSLEDIQGYNPVHVARYDDFIAALNGHPQNYHHTDIFESGLDSPLLDLLNVRYVVLPTVTASDEIAPHFERPLRVVYADETVQILENPLALPRAFIAHAAEQVASDDVGGVLSHGSRDLRRVAILEATPPPLAEPVDASQESVEVVSPEPDRVVMRASAAAAGLIVASEVFYPAWHAYVDGQAVTLYAVDRALRGVAVPAGEHMVEFRYESPQLVVGLIISSAAVALLVGLAILVCATRSGDGTGEVRCKTGAVPQL